MIVNSDSKEITPNLSQSFKLPPAASTTLAIQTADDEEDASLIDKKEEASRDGSSAEACKVSRKARGRLRGISEGQERLF